MKDNYPQAFIREKFGDWLLPLNSFVRELGHVPRGTRDLMWCPYLNEPAIIEWDGDNPVCPNCKNFEAATHTFMGHISKPRFV